MAETLLIIFGSVAAYLVAGWRIAIRNLPRAWAAARRFWKMDDSIRGSVKAQTVVMILFWPVYLPALAIGRRLDSAVDAGDPQALREKLAERDARIAQLERELGLPPVPRT
jgi:hypothetical protein